MRVATLVGIESIAVVFDFDISSEPLSAEVALQFLGGTAWPVIPDLAFPEIGALRAVLDIEHPRWQPQLEKLQKANADLAEATRKGQLLRKLGAQARAAAAFVSIAVPLLVFFSMQRYLVV